MIRRTRLGSAVLEDMGQYADINKGYYRETEWPQLAMVMTSKPGPDITKVKGWRPIALANTVGGGGGVTAVRRIVPQGGHRRKEGEERNRPDHFNRRVTSKDGGHDLWKGHIIGIQQPGRGKVAEILQQRTEMSDWVLRPRYFHIKIGGHS